MPEYGHLLEADLKFSAIQPLVKASNFLGAEYGDEEMTDAEGHARKQAERVAADIVKQGRTCRSSREASSSTDRLSATHWY